MINRLTNSVDFKKFNIVKTRKLLFSSYYKQLMRYLMQLIKIENLPDSIPEADLKFMLLSLGNVTIARADDSKLYAFEAALGGEPNPYYLPTLSIVANAGLRFNKVYEIDKDCVVVKTDDLYQGFSDIISLYASLLTIVDISIYWNAINSRTQTLYESANDDITKSIKEVFEKLEDGSELKAIASKPLFDLLKSKEFSTTANSQNIKSLIELKQYIKASYFMIIGLPSNYNMKRESLNENELDADIYTVTPLMDNLFDVLNKDFEKVNKMFNTSIKASRQSSLEKVSNDIDNREKEEELDIKTLEKQIEEPKEETKNDNKEVEKDEENNRND